LKKLADDNLGQVFTIEGVVAALILVVALSYIISSITLVSPQTEKSTLTKLNIKAQDILNVFSSEDIPGKHTSNLKRWVSNWGGTEPSVSQITSPSEPSMIALNDSISKVLLKNMAYNVYIYYYDSTTTQVSKTLIYNGEPSDNAGIATKLIVLNKNDSVNYTDSIWADMDMPKTVEIKIVVWPI